MNKKLIKGGIIAIAILAIASFAYFTHRVFTKDVKQSQTSFIQGKSYKVSNSNRIFIFNNGELEWIPDEATFMSLYGGLPQDGLNYETVNQDAIKDVKVSYILSSIDPSSVGNETLGSTFIYPTKNTTTTHTNTTNLEWTNASGTSLKTTATTTLANLIYTVNGTVGIGTSAQGTAGTILTLANGNVAVSSNYGMFYNGQWGYRPYDGSKSAFYVNNAEKVSILSTGNVGIGSTNPTSTFTVAGDFTARNATTSKLDTGNLNSTGQITLTNVTSNGLNPEGLTMWGGTNGGGLYARGDVSGGNDYFDISGYDGIKFSTVRGGWTDLLFITSGTVGIGTGSGSKPTSTLTVAGSFSAGSGIIGSATTTNLETGALVSTYDAGSIPLFTSLFSTLTTTTLQGGYVQSGNYPIFSWGCLPDGVTNNSCVTSSSRLTISAPIVFSAGVTTTVTTSTLLGIDASRYMVISGNATTGTCPQQLFATTTVATPGGTTVRLTSVSTTQLLIISDTCTTDVDTTLPFGGVSKTCYLKAGMSLDIAWYKNQNKWMPVNPSSYTCY
jgi:hypothetical protein